MLNRLMQHPYAATLGAVMIVVALWVGAARVFDGNRRDAQVTEARKAMIVMRAAAYRWHYLHGESTCPSIRQLLESRFLDPEAAKTDPWEQPFVITCMESGAVVTSFGPDRTRATPDDIVVATPNAELAATR